MATEGDPKVSPTTAKLIKRAERVVGWGRRSILSEHRSRGLIDDHVDLG